ncbi:GDP-perosamine synthase [subsurface metagenome]
MQTKTNIKVKIPWAKPTLFGNEKKYVSDALDSTWISGGPYVEKFEKEFTRYNGTKYGITTSNGTTALQLALLALGIGPGDEVIVPGFTFVAPANMVIAVGAKPVYAEIDPLTWCIDPVSVERSISDRTKAIIPVHIYGNVCDMDVLKTIAGKHNLAIIEDTAEAAFSKYKEKYAGTFADIGCFSFQATKTITMGEGGFVLTGNKKLYEKMCLFRDHGMQKDKRYWHDVIGYNFRLTNLQAALGCAQLENLDKIISERQRVFRLYREHLTGEIGITMQHFTPEVKPVIWAIALKIDSKVFQGGRDFLIKALSEVGIETRPGFYPFGVLPLYNAPRLPICEEVGANVISLPSFPQLTKEEINFVCTHLKNLRR